MKRIALLLAIVLLVLGSTVVLAQDEPVSDNPPMQEVTINDTFVVEVPEGWLSWRLEDSPIPAMRSRSYIDMIHQVDPDVEFDGPPELTYLQMMAIAPVMIDDIVLPIRIHFYPLSDLVEAAGIPVEEIVPEALVDAFDYALIDSALVNGRNVALGYRPYNQTEMTAIGVPIQSTAAIQIVAVYIFPDQDTIATITALYPVGYIDGNAEQILRNLLSLRLIDEAFDGMALAGLISALNPES